MPDSNGLDLLTLPCAVSGLPGNRSRTWLSVKGWDLDFARAVDVLRDYARLAWWEGSTIGLTGRSLHQLVCPFEADRSAFKLDER